MAVAELQPLRFSSEEDLEVCVSGVLPGTGVAADGSALLITWTASRAAIAISGEVDELTYHALADTLERLTAGLELVHVYLTGLEYCDLARLRVIVRLAAAGDHHRQLVLHDVPPHLVAVMCIVGWDITPGLVFHEQEGARAATTQMPAAGSLGPAGPVPRWRPGRVIIRALEMLVPRATKAGI
jgi:anti-anti-sigma regulatory factor